MFRFAIAIACLGSLVGGPTSQAVADDVPNFPNGIWISREEIRKLPMSGPAWEQLKAQADEPAGTPKLSNQNQHNNVYVLAKALVFARTGNEKYRTDVRANCMAAIGTEKGGRTLALGRELSAYVISADLVKLDPEEDKKFRSWLHECLTEDLKGRTLRSTHEDRPNNWGTHAGASRITVACYLQDKEELIRAAKVFKGWLGDRSSYDGFKYGDLSWQADPEHPRGINPKGSVKEGESIDGIMPDDMRRGDKFKFPPSETNYPWGALEGSLVQTEILSRCGYDAWNWEDKGLLRAAQALVNLDKRYPNKNWWATGDDVWMPWVINYAYGTAFATVNPARPGKNMGWTNWTHDPKTRPKN